MSKEDIVVKLSLVDRFTPELHRARWHFLTPIGRKVPPKGTIHRSMLELQVRFRQLGRVLVRDVPGASAVPWPEVRRVWGRRLDLLGTAYIAVALLAVLLYLFGRFVLGWSL